MTVRDAQRNARDTEILITLVRSAAEMRNSFEEMKKFIETQDEKILDTSEKQTQRMLTGPRPQPASLPRTPRRMSEDDEDKKRKNVFKRALKGLGLKSSNDLTHIEDMLYHLLGEVEALRAEQQGQVRTNGHTETRNSLDNTRGSLDGFRSHSQPETGLTNNPSARFSNSPRSTGDLKNLAAQREAERRISTVVEDNEDPLTPQEEELLGTQMNTDAHFIGRHKRGDSAPVTTPERTAVATGALSNDTTPKTSGDKSRKHKSSSSSFLPKISRWSKTTASSMGENLRNTIQPGRKERPYSDMSRSGSDLNLGGYATNDYYDHRGDDRLRSTTSLDHRPDNRPPSPLVPSQVSEHPKYRAHRDSLNLQHPQPRPGARYQTHLESEAQNYTHMDSPASDPWASSHSLAQQQQQQAMANTGRRSPLSDGGYSATSSMTSRQNAPPRPPKIRDDGPLVPHRPSSIKDGVQPSYADRVVLRETGNTGNPDTVCFILSSSSLLSLHRTSTD